MNREDLTEALEEAEERYLNNCNTPQVRGREMLYCDVIVDFVVAWLDASGAVVPDGKGGLWNARERWRKEMGA